MQAPKTGKGEFLLFHCFFHQVGYFRFKQVKHEIF